MHVLEMQHSALLKIFQLLIVLLNKKVLKHQNFKNNLMLLAVYKKLQHDKQNEQDDFPLRNA